MIIRQADSRLPPIWYPGGLHPLLTEGGPTDDENLTQVLPNKRHRTNTRTLGGCTPYEDGGRLEILRSFTI